MGDSNGKPADERAIEFLCDVRFHKSIVLPPDPTKGHPTPLRFSYSDYGYRDPTHPESEAVVLFCGPLMGGRLAYAQLDDLLKRNRVRIIHPDRPGIGGSDPVRIQDRIATWLQLVPYLLSHLGIKQVSLASHSGGVIYALNTILTLPHLLHPSTPYVAFFAPWVHYSHSSVSSLAILKYLPTPLVGKFASLTRFINNNVMPVIGYSGNLINTLKHSSPAPLPPSAAALAAEPDSTRELNDAMLFSQAFSDISMAYFFAEPVDGISEDAKLFLRKGRNTAWRCPSAPSEGVARWTDLDTFVPALCAKLVENTVAGVLTVDAFHAATDNMVGERGQKWFDECWDPEKWPEGVSEKLTYRSCMGPEGTDHNWLIAERWGLSETWAERVRESFPV